MTLRTVYMIKESGEFHGLNGIREIDFALTMDEAKDRVNDMVCMITNDDYFRYEINGGSKSIHIYDKSTDESCDIWIDECNLIVN